MALSALAEQLPERPETPRGIEPRLRRADDGAHVYRFRTRWKDPVTGKRLPSPEYDTVDEVQTFRALQGLARARGDVIKLTNHASTLEQFAELIYWRRHAREFLAPSTIASDRSVYRNHLLPTLGSVELRRLTAPVVEDLRDELLEAGVGRPTVRRALVILQSICTRAVASDVIGVNPVREVRKPKLAKRPAINAPGAVQIEALRLELDPVSAALVSVIGYEGLRPSEALALEERHLMRATILVEQRAIDGELVLGLKTSRDRERVHRSPKLYAAVRADLDLYLGERGPADARAGRRLLFPGEAGRPWTTYEYRRWREKVLVPAAKRAGVPIERPYDLRHGCASMLLHAHRPLSDISAHMGHTVATLSAYYSHMIEDLRDQAPVPVEGQIAAARRATR